MHPTQHSTITVRAPRGIEPRILRTHRLITHGTAQTAPQDDDSILDTVRSLAQRHSTRYVMLRDVAAALDLSASDRVAFTERIERLDAEGRLMLSPVERPQHLAPELAAWFVKNSLGIPCHEVTALDEALPQPMRIAAAHIPGPPWPRATDRSTSNKTVAQCAISELLRGAAENLQNMGRRAAA